MRRRALCACVVAAALGACSGLGAPELVINEVVVRNDGAFRDEWGQDDDYVELANTTDHVVSTRGFVVTDESGLRARLPARELQPGEVLLLVADGAPQQGPLHLPFKLRGEGEVLVLGRAHGFAADRVEVPALGPNEAFARSPSARGAFARCGTLTPGQPNAARCEPAPRPSTAQPP